MSRQARIEEKLKQALQPSFLELINESHMHSGPGTETHFKLVVVSEKFVGQSRVARSRIVYDLLNDEMSSGLHALAQRGYTPEEWAKMNETVEMASPPCLGGSKHDD